MSSSIVWPQTATDESVARKNLPGVQERKFPAMRLAENDAKEKSQMQEVDRDTERSVRAPDTLLQMDEAKGASDLHSAKEGTVENSPKKPFRVEHSLDSCDERRDRTKWEYNSGENEDK